MEKCTGKMEASIKETGKEVFNMEMDRFMSLEKGIKKDIFNKTF